MSYSNSSSYTEPSFVLAGVDMLAIITLAMIQQQQNTSLREEVGKLKERTDVKYTVSLEEKLNKLSETMENSISQIQDEITSSKMQTKDIRADIKNIKARVHSTPIVKEALPKPSINRNEPAIEKTSAPLPPPMNKAIYSLLEDFN